MNKDTIIFISEMLIFVIIILSIILYAIHLEELKQLECTRFTLEKGLSTVEIKSICGIRG